MQEQSAFRSDLIEGAPIDQALDRLARITRVMRVSALMVSTSTIFSLSGLIAIACYRAFPVKGVVYVSTMVLIATFALGAILLAVRFESLRKEGDAMFKEISDELQWYTRFGREENTAAATSAPEHRPNLESRLILRLFAQASDLPLAPGAFGPLLYSLTNILAVSLTALLLLPYFSRL